MPYLDARIFAVSERSDELALARLGAAAVLLWDRIEPDVQRDLLALAPVIAGVANAPNCDGVLARLIQKNSHPSQRREDLQSSASAYAAGQSQRG
jgi:hypothetical protein